MTQDHGLPAGLARLSDGELAAVLLAATANRPAFAALHSALLDIAAATDAVPGIDGDAVPGGTGSDPDVTPNTPVADEVRPPMSMSPLDQPHGGVSSTEVAGTTEFSPTGVPTFESVRDKVEQRFGTAQGADELDRQTGAGRSVDEQWEARENAARERLARIRKSLYGEDSDGS